MYNLAKAYRSIENPLPIAESRTGKPAMVTLKIQPDCSTVHDTTLSGEHICAQPFRMWNRLRFHTFMQVSPIFQRRKSDANKQDFENKLNLTCQAQSTPKTIGILTRVFCTSGPNLVVLAWTGDELSHGQAQNGVNFDFEVKFDLEGQGISPPKTIGILIKVFYTFGPNLAILAWTGPELSRGHTHTHGHTHTETQAMTIPEGQNWPRVTKTKTWKRFPHYRSFVIKDQWSGERFHVMTSSWLLRIRRSWAIFSRHSLGAEPYNTEPNLAGLVSP